MIAAAAGALALAALGARPAAAQESAGEAARAAAAEAGEAKASPAATEMLESLRERGVLTEEEFQNAYKRQVLYELEQREAAALPEWVRSWTFGGDVRLRWERIQSGRVRAGQELDSDVAVDALNGKALGTRDRGRLLLRLGAERQVGRDFEIGFRLATSQGTSFGDAAGPLGSSGRGRPLPSDPRSMNTTFGSYFAPKGIFVDRAYVRFAPSAVRSLELSAGKTANPFTSQDFPDSIVWDNDIQLEGATAAYGFDLVPERLRVELRGSYSFLDEIGAVDVVPGASGQPSSVAPNLDDADPYLYGAQGGLRFDVTPSLRVGTRMSYYDLRDLGPGFAAAVQDLGNGGGAIQSNPLFFDLSARDPLHEGPNSRGRMREVVYDAFARLGGADWALVAFAQSTQLLGVSGGEDRGLVYGLNLEAPWGTRLSFIAARIERNATIALFTDSDLFDGFTNVRGYAIALEHPLARNVRLRASFSSAQMLNESCDGARLAGVGQDGKPAYDYALCDTASAFSQLQSFRRRLQDRQRFQVDLRVAF